MKTPKFYQLFVAILLAFYLVGCQKDDSKPVPTAAQLLVGKWLLTDVRKPGPSEVLSECEKRSFFQFNQDGSFNAESFSWDCEVTAFEGTYSTTRDDKHLLISTAGSEEWVVFKIINLTKDNLEYNGDDIAYIFRKQK